MYIFMLVYIFGICISSYMYIFLPIIIGWAREIVNLRIIFNYVKK